jgi:hypothetical protein
MRRPRKTSFDICARPGTRKDLRRKGNITPSRLESTSHETGRCLPGRISSTTTPGKCIMPGLDWDRARHSLNLPDLLFGLDLSLCRPSIGYKGERSSPCSRQKM